MPRYLFLLNYLNRTKDQTKAYQGFFLNTVYKKGTKTKKLGGNKAYIDNLIYYQYLLILLCDNIL